MKKILLVLCFLLFSLNPALANGIDERCPQHVIFGAPVSSLPPNAGQYLCRLGYAVRYNYHTRTPEYVVERVTVAMATGPHRRRDDFRPDPEIPPQFRATLQDYAGQPFDRGHVAAAGNNTHDPRAMSESFLLSNMIPQDRNNNRGVWKQLETLTRDWIIQRGELFIVSGTVYNQPFRVIGNGVGVPDGLFKIIVDPRRQQIIAFMLPNAPMGANDFPRYIVSVAEIERATGITFFPQLPPASQGVKMQRANLQDWMR